MALEDSFSPPNSAGGPLQGPRGDGRAGSRGKSYGGIEGSVQREGTTDSQAQQMAAKMDEILPLDLLAQCLLHLTSFKDMVMASGVSKLWRVGVWHSLAYRDRLSFSGWRVDDETVSHMVEEAANLKELDLSAHSWGCKITDYGLQRISESKCCNNLLSISLCGLTAISDDGLTELVSRTHALKHLNVRGTYITDISLVAMAGLCKRLEVLNLWGCRHVTEKGLLCLVHGCPNLRIITLWGLTISSASLISLVKANPHIQLKRNLADV